MTTTDPTPASMGGPLSDADRLAEIQARLDAASPGPWHRRGKTVLGPREERDLGTGPAALLHTGMPYDGPNGRCGANAELAAHAPDDLAYLLGELDDAQRLFDALGSEAAEELKAAHAALTKLREQVGVLEGQLATARELHKPLPVRPNSGPGRSCGECLGNGYSAWPCATAKALGLDGGGSDER